MYSTCFIEPKDHIYRWNLTTEGSLVFAGTEQLTTFEEQKPLRYNFDLYIFGLGTEFGSASPVYR